MRGLELQISGFRSISSTNYATTTTRKGPLFVLRSLETTLQNKNCRLGRIRTWIVRVEGEHYYHLTTTKTYTFVGSRLLHRVGIISRKCFD